MAVFEVSIRKQLTANDLFAWSNVYHVQSTDLAGAVVHGDELVAMETALHSTAVTFHSMKVSTPHVPDAFTVRSITGAGTQAVVGDGLPVFIAVRVDYSAETGRPGRKFYHLLLGEATQSGGLLEPITVAGLQTIIDAATSDFATWLCNPAGTKLYTSGLVERALTEHQFRRKWARRGVPGP